MCNEENIREAKIEQASKALTAWMNRAFKFRLEERIFTIIMQYLLNKSKNEQEFKTLLNRLIKSIEDGTYHKLKINSLDELYEYLKEMKP